jgi:DNA-binding winged helix-turn-helix (wHTH) protein
MVPEAAAPVSGYHRPPMAVHFGSFTLDVPRRHLSRDGTSIHVTPKAFDLLALLVEQAPRVVGKGELHERLWPGTFVSDATLVGLVKELRRALDDRDAGSPIIRTVHRVGYAFCPDVVRRARTRSALPVHWLVLDGRRLALAEGENIIGRSPASHVCLDAPGVSRSHARIAVDGDVVRLTDLGSKNGTTVNDRRVAGEVLLNDGDRVGFGAAAGVYRSSAAGMSTETRADPAGSAKAPFDR